MTGNVQNILMLSKKRANNYYFIKQAYKDKIVVLFTITSSYVLFPVLIIKTRCTLTVQALTVGSALTSSPVQSAAAALGSARAVTCV